MIIGSLGIIGSVVLLILTAAMRSQGLHMAYAHMAVCIIVAIAFTLTFLQASAALRRAGAGQSAIAANTAKYIGMVWAWGALGLAFTYPTGVLVWREWPHFLAACVVLGGTCFALSAMLGKDAAAGKDDPTMLRIGHYLGIAVLVGMLAAIAGMLIDGKMVRFMTVRYTDWAANNIFFFGAIAMAFISGHALLTKSKT